MTAAQIVEFVLLGMFVGFIPQALGWVCGKLFSILNVI